MHVTEQSTVAISGSTFSRGRAQNGGAIHILSDSSGHISGCSFRHNFAERHGGAIKADYFGKLSIKGGSKFINNLAGDEMGDALYI